MIEYLTEAQIIITFFIMWSSYVLGVYLNIRYKNKIKERNKAMHDL